MLNYDFAQLNEHDRIITVNQRLATFLQQQYAEQQIAHDHYVWSAGHIISLNHWIDELWASTQLTAENPQTVLSPLQESLWWQSIVAQTHAELMNSAGLARQAQAAWQQCVQWNQSLDDIPLPAGDEVMTWLGWALAFEERCQSENVISAVQRLSLLSWRGSAGNPSNPVIYLAGFDIITPQLQSFLDHIQAQGHTISSFNFAASACAKRVFRFPDSASELTGILASIVQEQSEHSGQRYAIVVPDLQSQQGTLQHACESILTPAEVTYSISGGKSLAEYSIIHDALETLRFIQDGTSRRNERQYEKAKLIQWLQSPYLANAETYRLERDRIAQQVYTTLPGKISLQRFWRFCRDEVAALGLDSAILPSLSNLLPLPSNHQQLRHIWAEYFVVQLSSIGWPGERAINSEGYQAANKFYQVLQTWSTDFIAENLTFEAALQEMCYCVAHTLFQAEDVRDPEVQVLGLLEIGGLTFDRIHLLNMDDNTLPAQPTPNPFLPTEWQRQLQMPHSDAHREWQFATTLLSRLQTQTPQLTASYPQLLGDAPCAPSPLLWDWRQSVGQSIAVQLNDVMLEGLNDDIGLPLESLLKPVTGGSQLFKAQALCPFQAYARYRLQVSDVQEASEYLDMATRGTILHQILQRCWQEIQDQQTLCQYNEMRLHLLVNKHAGNVLYRWRKCLPDQITAAVKAIEQVRVTQLILQWLHQERVRPPFQVVTQEQAVTGEIGGVPIQLRLDRLDRLADGKQLVIDYKTGRTRIAAWLGQRPTEPQLPLYILLTDADAAAFAKLRSNELGFAGLSAGETEINGIQPIEDCRYTDQPDWAAQKQQWRGSFEQLAHEIQQGHAAVDPISKTEACQFCDLQRLCRVVS